MAESIVLRGFWDRMRYTLMFEALLITMVGIGLAYFTAREFLDTGTLALLLSIKAMLINLVYNYAFDRFDLRHGRVPSQRSTNGRLLHAVGFELVLVLTSLPIVMWWLEMSLWQALVMDLTIMAMIVVYTYLFTLCYDHWFPVAQPQCQA